MLDFHIAKKPVVEKNKAHARLSASSSQRWTNCPGSVKLSERAIAEGVVEADKPNKHSAEGSVAHELAERMLRCEDIVHLIGKDIEHSGFQVPVTQDMVEHVKDYVDFVRAEAQGGELFVEKRVEFNNWVPEGFGTSDAIILKDDTIMCIDLKFGRGIKVEAENNTQALLYALGVFQGLPPNKAWDYNRIVMIIHQPRLDHISSWQISVDEMLQIGENIKVSANSALSDNAEFKTGGWCRFCSAAPVCRTQEETLRQTVGDDFENLSSPTLLTNEQLLKIMNNKQTITNWLAAVENHIIETLNHGKDFPNYKLVPGRSLRKWSDEADIQSFLTEQLGDQAFAKKLISPNQAEKLIPKELKDSLKKYITKPEGRPTLVPADDPRPRIANVADEFDKV